MRELLIEKYEKPNKIVSGNIVVWKNKYDQIHRDYDFPAVICLNIPLNIPCVERWYKNGLLHRDNDKPAIIIGNGDKYWYKNGKRYKEIILEQNKTLIEGKWFPNIAVLDVYLDIFL